MIIVVYSQTLLASRSTPQGLEAFAFSGKESTCQTEDAGLIPGSGRSPGEGNGNPSILACKVLWTEEHGRLQSMGSHRFGHDLVTKQQQLHVTRTVPST